MSGLFNLILVFLLTACSVLFALFNQGEVEITLPGGLVFPGVPLFVLAFVPLFFGFFLGVISGWSRGLKYRKRLAALRSQNQELEAELTNLRNLPLDNDM
ncbi:MAG: LapA family protein [Magnetococcales bacterium]|nr:LapA family protein [Magnetococcales bacterium]